MTFITSTAQWSTRRNQVIFAVLDVSLNNGQLTVIKLLRFLYYLWSIRWSKTWCQKTPFLTVHSFKTPKSICIILLKLTPVKCRLYLFIFIIDKVTQRYYAICLISRWLKLYVGLCLKYEYLSGYRLMSRRRRHRSALNFAWWWISVSDTKLPLWGYHQGPQSPKF